MVWRYESHVTCRWQGAIGAPLRVGWTVVFGVGRVRRACGDSDCTGVAVTTFEM